MSHKGFTLCIDHSCRHPFLGRSKQWLVTGWSKSVSSKNSLISLNILSLIPAFSASLKNCMLILPGAKLRGNNPSSNAKSLSSICILLFKRSYAALWLRSGSWQKHETFHGCFQCCRDTQKSHLMIIIYWQTMK